jgi:hypothetical protein
MPENLVALQVFLASPGDVQEERVLARSVIEELDRTTARKLGFSLEAVGWETHARPGVGVDAQEIISRRIRPRDVFVGVMWARLGTPTGRAGSGTIEEFEQALALHRAGEEIEVLLYFCTRDVPRDGAEQVAQVLEFQRRCAEEGVYSREYKDPHEFGTLLREHLAQVLFDWTTRDLRAPAAAEVEMTGRASLLQFAAAAEKEAREALSELAALGSVVGQIERRSSLPVMDGWPAEDQCAVADRAVHAVLPPAYRLATLVAQLRDRLNQLDGLLGSVMGENARLDTTLDSSEYLSAQVSEIGGRLNELRTRIEVQQQTCRSRAEAQTREWLKVAIALDEPISLLAAGVEVSGSWQW